MTDIPHPRPRDLAASLLAAGHTLAGAAGVLGKSEKTLRRWWGEPDFRAEVLRLRRELIEATTGVLTDGAQRAARALVELLGHEAAGVRLNAAKALLDQAGRYREIESIEGRLADLEARVMSGGRARGRAG